MDLESRLTARASQAGIQVPAALADRLAAYFRLLARWNQRINLTALPLEPASDQAIDRLLVEPLAASTGLTLDAANWFDFGSGGGSPAIPLKLARPAFRLTMVESRERKAAFLREACRELSLVHASVEAERVEVLAARPGLGGTADLVTVRAVRLDDELLGSISALLRPGGLVTFFGVSSSDLELPAGFGLVVDSPACPVHSAFDIAIARRVA